MKGKDGEVRGGRDCMREEGQGRKEGGKGGRKRREEKEGLLT